MSFSDYKQIVYHFWTTQCNRRSETLSEVKTCEGLGHFVVLHRVSQQKVVIADPASGIESLSKDEFCKKWTGYLVLMTPSDRKAVVDPAISVGPSRRFLGLLFVAILQHCGPSSLCAPTNARSDGTFRFAILPLCGRYFCG